MTLLLSISLALFLASDLLALAEWTGAAPVAFGGPP